MAKALTLITASAFHSIISLIESRVMLKGKQIRVEFFGKMIRCCCCRIDDHRDRLRAGINIVDYLSERCQKNVLFKNREILIFFQVMILDNAPAVCIGDCAHFG